MALLLGSHGGGLGCGKVKKQLRTNGTSPNFSFRATEEVSTLVCREAMERAITLATPENTTTPNGKMKQNTTGNGIPSSSSSPSRSDIKVECRYLRPTMASCHDNCKYGWKLDYEAASRNFRTFRKKNIVLEREKKQAAATAANGEGRRTRPESDFSDKPGFSKPKAPDLTEKSTTPAEKKALGTSQGNKLNQDKCLNPDGEDRAEAIELISTPLHPQPSPDKPNVVNLTSLSSPDSEADALQDPGSVLSSVASTETKLKAPPSAEKPQTVERKAPLPPLKRVDATASLRSAILSKAKAPFMRSISHHLKSLEDKKATKSLGFLELGGVASKHPLNSLKTKAPLLRSVSARRNQERMGEGAARPSLNSARGDRESKTTKSDLRAPNFAGRKLLKTIPACFSSKAPGEPRNVKNSTSVKPKHKAGGANDSKSEAAGSESVTNETPEVGNERGARRSSEARPEDTTSVPYKLKFRQGKVMDLRGDSTISAGATRLWFRPGVGRTAGDNPSDDSSAWRRRRSFRKEKNIGIGDSDPSSLPPSSEAQAVVLKHQEPEEKKKDAQSLLNHMIEEAASRLVGARKSKVKALVGAFETVMSRQ